MSKIDAKWTVEISSKRHTPKREKTDTEVQIRLTFPQQEGRQDHTLQDLFLQTIMTSKKVDIRVLIKRREALKESAATDYTKITLIQQSKFVTVKTTIRRITCFPLDPQDCQRRIPRAGQEIV
jgi:hypothetical protein